MRVSILAKEVYKDYKYFLAKTEDHKAAMDLLIIAYTSYADNRPYIERRLSPAPDTEASEK